MVAAALKSGNPAQLNNALLGVVQAQERLFGRPVSEFQGADVAAQLALLSQNESPDQAREKCLAYAEILDQAGRIYEGRRQPALAASAFQLALYVHLLVAERQDPSEAQRQSIASLLEKIPPRELHAPVRELLDRAPWRG